VLRIGFGESLCHREPDRILISQSGRQSSKSGCFGSATKIVSASLSHDYGIHKGIIKLFGYQVAGSSSRKLPTWRWAEPDLMSDIQMLDRTFPGGRPTKSGRHHKWDKLFIRVKPPDTDQK